VLISGATRGIGEATALLLERIGFRVFAGDRSLDDADALRRRSSDRLTPVALDVTEAESVAAAAASVEAAVGPAGLWGLVNNAGIVVPGPLELLPAEELHRQFDVNVYGVARLTQAVLPALRRARGPGRIVNVSSVNGRLATPWAVAYAASKFALEALSDGFRAELRKWGIQVIVVQPGAIHTAIWDTTRERAQHIVAAIPEEQKSLYRGVIDALARFRMPERALPPSHVAEVIAKALTAPRPRTRYRVGWDAKLGVLLAALLPDRLITHLVTRRRANRPRQA
jgi:NAD(P)-dependent dehydrogenase (short-subunit alcohol dehydrogenase family)